MLDTTRRKGLTGWPLDAIRGEGHVIFRRSGTELEVHRLDVALLMGDGGGGDEAEGRGEEREVLHDDAV